MKGVYGVCGDEGRLHCCGEGGGGWRYWDGETAVHGLSSHANGICRFTCANNCQHARRWHEWAETNIKKLPTGLTPMPVLVLFDEDVEDVAPTVSAVSAPPLPELCFPD